MNNFLQRTLTGIVFVVVLIGGTYFHPYSIFLLFMLISNVAVYEFYSITKTDTVQPQIVTGIALNSILQIISFLTALNLVGLNYLSLILPVGLIVFCIELYRKKPLPFNDIAYTLLANAYISVPFALVYAIAINGVSGAFFSPELVIAVLVLVWTNDTGAYLFGMSFGKRKLFERISPKKSWEGAVGGTLAVLGVAYAISLYVPYISALHWMILGFVVSVAANFGDLAESMLKRSIGIKDSGSILPGHGGMLDRFDGVIFAIPAFFAYLQLFN